MAKGQVTIPVFVPHQGCPHQCSFCNQWKTSSTDALPDGSYIHKIVNQYRKLIASSVTRVEIAFFGGSFTGIQKEKQKELLEAANKFLIEKSINGIRVSTRPDYISEETLDLLKRYSVSTVEIGAQSFHDEVLKASGRGHSAADITAAAKLIRRKGFDLIIQLMPGLPGDTQKRSIESANQTAILNPAAVRIYPTVILKDTPLEQLYRQGKFTPLSLEEAIDTCSSMYQIFSENSIPVIRMGLHPFSEKEMESIIDGPYHPALGFFVKSRLKRKKMEEMIARYISKNSGKTIQKVTLLLPKIETEEYIGFKKDNIAYLQKLFHFNIEYQITDEDVLKISH